MEKVIRTVCVSCDEVLEIASGTYVGEIVSCAFCGQEHEVLDNQNGYRVGLAPEAEEDWGE